jgi:hypothetical protein
MRHFPLNIAAGLAVFALVHSTCLGEEAYVFTRDIPSGLKSEEGKDSTKLKISILNKTKRFLDFRWLNYQGNLELVRPRDPDHGHASIAPNNTFVQETFIGHPWVISDMLSGKLFGCLNFRKTGDFQIVAEEGPDGLRLSQAD